MNNTKRIPRPMGITELSQRHTQSLSEEERLQNLKTLEDHLIRHYINNNYHYCNEPMDIITFSNYTNITEHRIHEALIHRTKDMGQLLRDDAIEETYRGLFSLILSGALNDRLTAEMHQSILLKSQGTSYAPFISGEVTKALKLTQESNAQLLNLAKALIPNKGPNVLNQFNQQNNYNGALPESGERPVTLDEVLTIIQQSDDYVPLLEDEEQKAKLALEYDIANMPIVKATDQQGLDTSKEGLDFDKIAKVPLGMLPFDEDIETKHIDRRAEQMLMDMDEDDI